MTTRLETWARWHSNLDTRRSRLHGRPRGHRRVHKARVVMANNETGFVVDRSPLYVRR